MQNGIAFSMDRWARVKENAEAWWRGDLKRPLIQLTLSGYDAVRTEPAIPADLFTAAYGEEVSATSIVDRWDYDLSRLHFAGDSFPHVWPNFGAGVLAEFMGARAEYREETVWFHPPEVAEAGWGTPLRLQSTHPTLTRVADIMREANNRWQGLVQVDMTDLGGSMDILSTFRPGEKLLLDLYDDPECVKKRLKEAHAEWWRAFEMLNGVLQPLNPGYSSWASVYSERPGYMLQCDFCYMVGPAMFDEFVKPELVESCRKLDYAFYHLDGPGQLAHLDSLLDIEELKGVQWIPGPGSGFDAWPEVYRKIKAAGKKIWISGSVDADGHCILDDLA